MNQKGTRLLLIFQTYFLQISMSVALKSILVLNKRPVSIAKENLSVFALKDMSEMEKTIALQLVSAKFVLESKLLHDLFYTQVLSLLNRCKHILGFLMTSRQQCCERGPCRFFR